MQSTNYDIGEVIEKAENLSYIPTIVLRLMETISHPDVLVHEIVEVIKKDQGMVARVFKVANSSFYGRLKKAENLTDAVVTLGLRGIRSLILAQAVKQVLINADTGDHSLWEHATKVSTSSMVVAKELRCDILDNAMLGGLVHDIGKAFVASVYPEIPSLIYQKIAENQIVYEEAERIILHFDHAEVGAIITEKWNFPRTIVDVIRYHHCADDVKDVCTESRSLIYIVKLADVISKQYDNLLSFSVENVLEKLNSVGTFNLTADRLIHLMEEVKIKWKMEDENNLF